MSETCCKARRWLNLSGHHPLPVARIFSILLVASLFFAPAARAVQTGGQAALLAERALVRGLTHLRTGNVDRAATELTEGLKVSPNEPALLAAMADVQRARGDLSSAQFYVRKALEFAPDNASVLRLAVDVGIESSNLPMALDAAGHLVRTRPGDVHAVLELAELQSRTNQYADALATLTPAERAFSDYTPLLLVKADVLEKMGRLAEAIVVLERIVLLTNDTDVMYRLAGAQVQGNSPNQAAATLILLLEEDPYHEDALVTLAGLIERPDGDQILALIPHGLRNRLQREPTSAQSDPLTALLHRLETQPENGQIALQYAEALLMEGRPGEAAAFARQRVEKDPAGIDMWGLGVRALVEAESWTEAVEFSDEAVLLFPGYVPLLYERARALAGSGDAEQASSILRRALERMDEDHEMRQRMEAFLARLGNPQ